MYTLISHAVLMCSFTATTTVVFHIPETLFVPHVVHNAVYADLL